MHARLAGALGCALVALAGCTSSGADTAASTPPGPLPATSTPTTDATTPTPSTPASSSSAPLSHFEADPGVQALREWADVAAQTINSGHYISDRLRQLMTATVAKEMKRTMGTDVGLHYPGPIPFTPVRVGVTSTTSRQIDACFVSSGFARKPRSEKPAKPLKIIAVRTEETQTSGRWLLAGLVSTNSFSCAGVQVPRPMF
jgi:hypothetical protein